jgi:hypothetical protein
LINIAFTDKFNKTTHLILKAHFTEKHDEKEISYSEIKGEQVNEEVKDDRTMFVEPNDENEGKKKESIIINTIN